jgi:hypothetical protein
MDYLDRMNLATAALNPSILSQARAVHAGKTVDSITADGVSADLVMAHEVVIKFTDGSSIVLALDWRGDECYISQRTRATIGAAGTAILETQANLRQP